MVRGRVCSSVTSGEENLTDAPPDAVKLSEDENDIVDIVSSSSRDIACFKQRRDSRWEISKGDRRSRGDGPGRERFITAFLAEVSRKPSPSVDAMQSIFNLEGCQCSEKERSEEL